jgi:Yip1 domain
MDISRLMARVKLILTSPKTEWNAIEGEQTSTKELYIGYILILAAITPVASFLKMSILGIKIPFVGTYRIGIGPSLGNMVLNYIFILVGVYVMALIVDMLAPTFGGSKNQQQALKTVTYAYTAAWVAGILQLIPWIGIPLLLAGSLYSIYLLYLGLPVTMKCPTEKSMGYTAVSIIIAIVISFAISAVVGGITGVNMRGAMTAPQTGMQGSGSFDKNSLGGKLEDWSKKMESAGKEMEQAQKSGDAEAQRKAASKMMATAMGSKGTIETLAPDRIKAFLPEKLAGKTRSDVSAERNGAMGFQISTAQASYKDDSGHNLEVEITDMGLAKGVMALAGWAGVEQEKSTEDGFEKTYKQGSRMVHEQWDSKSHTGEYTTIVANRFSVKISGEAADIDVLKNAVQSMDLSGLEALKDEGMTKENQK